MFASFDSPRPIYLLAKSGSLREYRKRREARKHCGPYMTNHKPSGKSVSFYLESDFMPGLRWQWADEVCRSIRHTGWFTDPYGDGDTIRGIVFRLPRDRGFLAGWSMGEGMASIAECYIYPDESSAASAADSMAQYASEREIENYQNDEA